MADDATHVGVEANSAEVC